MIVALALRLAARRLIQAAQIGDAVVYDSAISGLEDLIRSQPVPIIIVSTEDERANTTVRDVLGGERSLDLIVEVALGSAYRADNPDDPEGVDVPATDAGMELSINLIVRQIMRALFEARGPWAKLFAKIAVSVRSVQTRRGASATGTRFAARQIIITVEPLDEPPFGTEPEGIWTDFLAIAADDPEIGALVPGIRAAIVGDPIEDWRRPWTVLGMTDDQALATGLAPLAGEESDPIDQMTVDGRTYTEEDVTRNLPPEASDARVR